MIVDAEGFIPSFASNVRLRAYAERNHYALEEEAPIPHDLDWVDFWTKAPDAQIDCDKTLAAWNLFSDVAHSAPGPGVLFERLDAQSVNIYKKVFWEQPCRRHTERQKACPQRGRPKKSLH